MARSSHEILERATTIAVMGASRDPDKAGGSVPVGLQQRGFRIIPINIADTLFGERVYRSLGECQSRSTLSTCSDPLKTRLRSRDRRSRPAPALWLQLDIRSRKRGGLRRRQGSTSSRTSAPLW
jgi:predicted CoA-binding protein